MRRRAAVVATVVTALGSVFGGRRVWQNRTHLVRTGRVWWLTTRRGAHWAVTRLRQAGAEEEERARLDEQFAIRTAEDVARELGHMKGAIMKAGQMVSFIADGLPPEARAALASLQSDVPPMAPSLAEQVVRDELGAHPDRLFLQWDPVPTAAASIGQVHRAVLHDGRVVAVKVQYPGVGDAITSDLDNAELLYRMFSAMALRNLDVKALVDELRERMADELDYIHEAACQSEMAEMYRDHPFISIPAVVPERTTRRVLTSEWAGGARWDDFLTDSDDAARQRAAEVIFRFAQGSVHRYGVFNGDPHPGNYRFAPDGSVTFLDFGLVKRWAPGEWERLSPVLDHLLVEDRDATVAAMVDAGFLPADHGLDPALVWDYVSGPYLPYLQDEFTFTPSSTSEALGRLLDVKGPFAPIVHALDLPPSFVLLDRVVWGTAAVLGHLHAHNRWRAILSEYRADVPPATPLGEQESAWRRRRAGAA
jgi:predicted unusual protein kinase regulating ubiquinone biosynthesis (AarF/ABC1/UbiB family)